MARIVAGIVALLLAVHDVPAASPEPSPQVRSFLTTHFGLAAGDLRPLDRGAPVARTLETSDGREVATLGVIRLRVPPDFYITQLRDIARFKQGDAVLQIGTFSQPAQLDDLAAMSLDAKDLRDLPRCRPGSCDVQLSEEALLRFAREVRWTAPDATAAANGVMRAVLVDLVNGYRARGDAALMTYRDGKRPLSLADEFRAMIASRPAVLERFARLHRHVANFPQRSEEGIDDLVYWSKEKMGPAVIVSVTHLSIAPLSENAPAVFAAASKQIYGSHYFDSSLGVTVLLEDAAGADHSYLVYVNRSRIDTLAGFWGGLKRTIVKSRTRSAMARSLEEAQQLVEGRFQRASPSAFAAADGPRRGSAAPRGGSAIVLGRFDFVGVQPLVAER